jgi:hypothetical protein
MMGLGIAAATDSTDVVLGNPLFGLPFSLRHIFPSALQRSGRVKG